MEAITWMISLLANFIALIALSSLTAIMVWVYLKVGAALLGFYSIREAFQYFDKWLKRRLLKAEITRNRPKIDQNP